MTSPKIHYLVRHAVAETSETGEPILKKHTEKVFKNENPIRARDEAFSYFKDYQEGVEEYCREYMKTDFIEKADKTVKQAKKGSSDHSEIEIPDGMADKDATELKRLWNELQSSPPLNMEIWENITPHGDAIVILVRDNSLIDAEFDDTPELTIHRTITANSDTYEIDEMMWNLKTEYEIYKQLGHDAEGHVTRVYYWSSEPYFEGYEDETWAEWYTILKTPFDWSPYQKENWWNAPDFFENHQRKLINEYIRNHFNQHEDLIAGGETETVEFKPLLFGTIRGKDKNGNPKSRNMGLEVAQVICSFMNKHGGNIYIGVKDNGVIDGVDLETKNNEDDYTRAFSTMKRYFFKDQPSLVYHFICGRFVTVDDKRLFCITVQENKERPTFLYNRDAPGGGQYHEFYAREGTSSLLLYDAKDLTEYIEEKWWRKKYDKS